MGLQAPLISVAVSSQPDDGAIDSRTMGNDFCLDKRQDVLQNKTKGSITILMNLPKLVITFIKKETHIRRHRVNHQNQTDSHTVQR